MAPLNVFLKVKMKSFLKKARKGAPVLETILLVLAAIVIIGVVINLFVSGDKSIIAQIYGKIKEILGLQSTPENLYKP